jgi:hypothetical protein
MYPLSSLTRETQGMTEGQAMNYIRHVQALPPLNATVVNSTKSMWH